MNQVPVKELPPVNRIFMVEVRAQADRCQVGSKSRWLASLSESTTGAIGHRRSNLRVVPADAPLVLRGVELVDEIECLGIIGRGDEAVGEALGDVHHPAILGGQFGPEALAEAWRAGRRSRIRS